MNTLFHLSMSPWSERARWALDACGIEHERVEHVPFVGELALRRRAGTRRASVPLLIAEDGTRVQGSWDIARWADANGRPGLFPDGALDDIDQWNTVSERLLNIARARMFPRLERSTDALLASVPGALRFLGPAAVASARLGVRFLAKKYRVSGGDATEAELRDGFIAWREALGGRPTVYGALSYADVTMATALQGIRPLDDRWQPLSPATREVWTEPALAEEFSDLLAWRDALYGEHRHKA